MAKDYAKRVLTTYKKPKKKKIRLHLVVLPLALIGIISYWFFAHHPLMANSHWLAFFKAKTHTAKTLAQNSEENSPPPVHFDFYNQLPNQRVPAPAPSNQTAPVNTAAVSKPKPTPEKSTLARYIVILGEFNNQKDAGQLRISLLLSECEAEMVEAKTSQGKVFRVQKGPFETLAEAKKIQKQLEKKGVPSELVHSA